MCSAERKDLGYEEDMKSRLSLLGVMSRYHHHLLNPVPVGMSKNLGGSKNVNLILCSLKNVKVLLFPSISSKNENNISIWQKFYFFFVFLKLSVLIFWTKKCRNTINVEFLSNYDVIFRVDWHKNKRFWKRTTCNTAKRKLSKFEVPVVVNLKHIF